jgi:hypothetical protein
MSIADVSRIAAFAPNGTRGIGDAPALKGPSENALVSVVATPQRSPLPGQSHLRSEAPFLAHLIATAELIPQTRTLRRATPTEAQAAYQSTAQNATVVTGVQVRQDA